MERNPFKPTAGANPPLLIGRDDLVDEFAESIADGPGAPMRLSIFTGARGFGKTVMLNAIADRIQDEFQWLVVHETATPGFLDRLVRAVTRLAAPESGRSITGVTLPSFLGGGGVELSAPDREPPRDFREAIGPLLDRCEEHGTGVLITLDEIHPDNGGELRQLAAAVQHLIREERQFAFAMAGLPTTVDDLLTDSQITFLRRADRRDLREVPLGEVADALRATLAERGRAIDLDALAIAARATGGYPFMIQLVGYQIWRTAEGDTITAADVRAGVDRARSRLGALVHTPALKELSEIDRTYLFAMALDDGPSRSADIARRMGKSLQYTGVYRARLIAAGMIEPHRHGQVRYAIPYLRDHIVGQPAFQEWANERDEI